MTVVLLCLAQFVIVLDVTIVAIALPEIRADLAMSTTGLGWVVTAYTLTFGGPLLAAGRLADQLGRRRIFVAGIALFGLGVASVASTATGMAALDGARRGLASGMLSTSAQLGTVLGVAVVIPLASAWTDARGGDLDAQVSGFELGFTLAAAVAGMAALVVAVKRTRPFVLPVRAAGGSRGRVRQAVPDQVGPRDAS